MVTRQRLLVALEDFGDLHDIGDVDVGKDVHQLLKVRDVLVPEFGVLQLAVGSLAVLAWKKTGHLKRVQLKAKRKG